MAEDINSKLLSFYYIAARCMRRRWIRHRLEQLFRSCSNSKKMAILACYYGDYPNPNVYPADLFSSLMEVSFEDMRIPVPERYDEILAARYGSRYMEIPEKEKRISHSNVLFSTECSWKEMK